MKYKDLDIAIQFNEEESNKHLEEDFKVLEERGIENIIIEEFMPWLLGDDYRDLKVEEVFKSLKLYEVNYHYGRIVEKYSPTGEDNFFGQFEFCFERADDTFMELYDAVCMEVKVLDGKIVDVGGYDI